ncbi:MAG: CoA-acylating methylmalonate-semialdehyde dehydrogenase [Phycisphaerae bacterium]|jgi:malonate-semialdehyde dehydrogenase (acetylating)/methylmalonate-semialdehyde dehydrogenase
MPDADVCRNLVAGRWVTPRTARFAEVWNPSTGATIARTPLCGPEEIDAAVQAAARAFPAWRETPAPDRARILFRFRELLTRDAEDLARIVTREHGKTLAEARASVQRGVEMVEFACGLPALLAGEVVENLAPGVDCETVRHPLGVVAGITPFNFPAMVPLWMFPGALVCGNCFVLKPSERVPLSSIRLGELLLEAGIPEGVFSIVHGDKAAVDALLAHPLVKAISFVGSTPVARHIYTAGTANGKRVQANGGAKNHIVIMPDADLDMTVPALQAAAFGCAGERCMAASLAVPVGDVADELVERLAASARTMRVGRTDTGAEVDMGPLITRAHAERVRGHIDAAEREGAVLAADGRATRVADAPGGFFVGPTVVDRVRPEMRIAREEVFGPVLSVTRVASLEEALALGDACEYGNGAAIYTRSGRAAREFKRRFNAGMIGVNVGVPAPMAWFPFTGWNASFFGDLHIQGREGMLFYTQQRMTMTRWPEPRAQDQHDPLWRPGRS